MITIKQNTGFAFVLEEGTEIDSTNNMPTSFELLFETFFDMFSCIFEIGYLVFDHLHVDVLSD